MPSAAVLGHYKIFNALQNKTEQNSENTTVKQSDNKHLERTIFST